jgi:cellulose biosynthesis protein BcsQ
VARTPYVLAVISHKGGTGRTTAALALAWNWAATGRKVSVVDADPIRSASLVALDANRHCPWPNVQFVTGTDSLAAPLTGEVVVIDCPNLLDPANSRPILEEADGIVLTCLADPLSIRTVPAAANVIEAAKGVNPRLELLGILISIYNERDPVHTAMLGRLRQSHQDLLLEPVVPYQAEVRDWPLHPGTSPPPGPARDAYAALTQALDPWIAVGRVV